MIISIDHIALAVGSVAPYKNLFTSLGYTVLFYEKNLPNLKIKQGLMAQFTDRQDLCFLSSPSSINIECIDHHVAPSAQARLTAVFETIPESIHISDNLLPHIAVRSKGDDFLFQTIRQPSVNIKKSIFFWELLGFHIVSQNSQDTRLIFTSPISKKKCYIELYLDTTLSPMSRLDSAGFNCMAFICTDAVKERARLQEAGLNVTNIERVDINSRALNIFFVRNAQGDIAELISIEQKS